MDFLVQREDYITAVRTFSWYENEGMSRCVTQWHLRCLRLQGCWDSVAWPYRVEGNRSGVLPTLPAGNGSWHVVAPKICQKRERPQRALGGIDKNCAGRLQQLNSRNKKQPSDQARSLGPFYFQHRASF